jgi:hypothetical protein
MSEQKANSYLIVLQSSAITLTGTASLAARGLADLRGKGTAESMFRRAMMYMGKRHQDKRVELLQRTIALDLEHDAARTQLGIAYSARSGTDQDETLAARFFLEAAERGYARAQFYLAECFLNGSGVPQNINNAVEWYLNYAQGRLGTPENPGLKQ